MEKTRVANIVVPFLLFLPSTQQIHAQNKWVGNVSVEAGWAMGGLTTLKATENPLVKTDLVNQGIYEAGMYAELLNVKKRRQPSEWGSVKPTFGIKTGINWTFSKATDEENFNNNESLGLNYINIPFLLEFCLGYKLGVTAASRSSDTYEGRANYDGSVTIRHTPGTYNPGGSPTQAATFFYTGPTFGYLIKSFNFTGDPINNVNLVKRNIGWNVGLVFWLGKISLDLSYQKGLTTIYKGKDIPNYAYLFKLGISLTNRRYQ